MLENVQPQSLPEHLLNKACKGPFSLVVASLKVELEKRNLILFAEINHAAGALKVGAELRPTSVFIFGNPKAGTPLMQASQVMGLDLPLKILLWEDETNKVNISYQNLAYLVKTYGVSEQVDIKVLSSVLESITDTISNSE